MFLAFLTGQQLVTKRAHTGLARRVIAANASRPVPGRNCAQMESWSLSSQSLNRSNDSKNPNHLDPKQGDGRRRRQFAVERSGSDGATLTGADARRALRSDRLRRIGQLTDEHDSC